MYSEAVISLSVQISMWVSFAVLAVLPIAALVVSAKRAEMNLSAVLVGLSAFVVFDTVLLVTVFDQLIFNTLSPGLRDAVFSSAGGFTVYYTVTRMLFYFVGFYVASRLVMKSDTNGAGLAIAAGFAGGKLLLDGAYQVFQSIRTVWVINDLGAAGYLAQAAAEGASESDIEALQSSITSLSNAAVSDFYIACAETVMLGVILFAIGYVVYLACTHRAPAFFLYVTMAVLAVALVAPAMLNAGLLDRTIADVLTLVATAGVCYYAVVMGKKYRNNQLKW